MIAKLGAKALRDVEMQDLIERIDHQNVRQGEWLKTPIKQALEALMGPLYDDGFLLAAELLQAGCNETVALPGKDWGYAMPGLQEEGA